MKKNLLSLLFLLTLSLYAHAQIITTIAGSDTTILGDGGLATACELLNPSSVAVDAIGNIFIADRYHNRIRKVNSFGIITTIAGTGTVGYSGDNGPATAAELNNPYSIVLDSSGVIYFSDNKNYCIRKITASGIISTIAGNGTYGYNGDNIPATAAELNGPGGIAIDLGGNIYIPDIGNNRIRKVDITGIITTVAGNGNPGYNGDGLAATLAELYSPNGVAVDNLGYIYIADYQNSCIRKINPSGIITTIAGTGVAGYGGDNAPATIAQLRDPGGVAVDRNGNVYIGDSNNDRVRKIDASGIITTIAGTGGSGYSGDGGPAVLAEIFAPVGIAIDGAGSIYFADYGNNRIRYIKNTVSVNSINDPGKSISIYPNPCEGIFTANISMNFDEQVQIIITNTIGQKIKEISGITNKPINIALDVLPGIYFISARTESQFWSGKVLVDR